MGNLNPFESKEIRTQWDSEKEQWFFSVIDVIEILTDSSLPKRYWSDLKHKLSQECKETYDNIVRLKMNASDGSLRITDVADTATLLRIIQSIPSPKAEPFKQWLAKVGYERMRETAETEQSQGGEAGTRQDSGRSIKWIQQQNTGKEVLKKLSGYWMQNIEKPDESNLSGNTVQQDWGED